MATNVSEIARSRTKAISHRLDVISLDLRIIRRLAQKICDADIQDAADIASSIEALATRAGRATDECAHGHNNQCQCDWEDYPSLAKFEVETRHVQS